jgi:phosphoribosylformylglycinamidine cyclo-ligase
MQRVFNCGIGMCVIVAPSQAHAVIDRLTAAGEIVSDIGSIQARPQGEAATVITTVD